MVVIDADSTAVSFPVFGGAGGLAASFLTGACGLSLAVVHRFLLLQPKGFLRWCVGSAVAAHGLSNCGSLGQLPLGV